MLTGKNPDYGACEQIRHMNMVNSVIAYIEVLKQTLKETLMSSLRKPKQILKEKHSAERPSRLT